MRYPVYIPEITEREKRYVNDCMESTWISSRGKYIERFEKSVSEYTGAKYCLSVHNGTVALHLALLGLEIKEGDEVIIPDFTYVATANAVKYVNATPVFTEVDADSWNITAESINKVITPKTKAIIVADIYGCPVDFESIQLLAKKHNLFIIEDAAESFGSEYKNIKTGNICDIATFSFFGNKTITTGEGGMVLTNDRVVAKRISQLKNQGNSFTVRYYHDILGYNYRMTNIQAAIGCAQIERIDSILDRKRKIHEYYQANIKNNVKFQKIESFMKSSYWMNGFILPDEKIKAKLMDHLESNGIEIRPFFYPVHQMPYLKDAGQKTQDKLYPVSEHLFSNGIILPSYPTLTEEDLNFIISKVNEVI